MPATVDSPAIYTVASLSYLQPVTSRLNNIHNAATQDIIRGLHVANPLRSVVQATSVRALWCFRYSREQRHRIDSMAQMSIEPQVNMFVSPRNCALVPHQLSSTGIPPRNRRQCASSIQRRNILNYTSLYQKTKYPPTLSCLTDGAMKRSNTKRLPTRRRARKRAIKRFFGAVNKRRKRTLNGHG